ncbi:fumarylacetoacetate hydrolase family protein [Luteimonas sp. BDR2-5]|uniref:fumarylacetoacetate hydrolase family protein n=1 Tax=Proluteimonas luteida TaxID=2878685 RepID=UPI001E287F79|nr:fumarylacetoacetate hydrolase family protein [Luteimonas sp. BDR2-5]MCD9029744.1 fumarylacetoacetate hydrolase family protein [Luteimonas sp. BDR2-5]
MIDNNRRKFVSTGLAGVAAMSVAGTGIARAAAGGAAAPTSVDTVIPPPAQVYLPVTGEAGKFPVRRIHCVGRNYLAHIRELNNNDAEPPFFFQKQRDMIVQSGGKMRYPALTDDFQFETELVVAIKAAGYNVTPDQVPDLIYGYAVGFDMTRRDRQSDMKAMEKPWEIGKSFEDSAPCGAITPIAKTGFLERGRIRLDVNDKVRQDSDLDHMIWNVREIIVELSKQVELGAGDLIYTGTPEGVGPVVRGDHMVATIDGLEPLVIDVV